MDLPAHEQQWLDAQRWLRRRVFVGIDHHTVQLTVESIKKWGRSLASAG